MKIFISGYGKMGKMIRELLDDSEFAGYSEDIASADTTSTKEMVCIDFTTPDAFLANYKFLADNFKAVVVGTTGWYAHKEEIFNYFEKKGTTMIWASNFSLGVNIFEKAVKQVSSMLYAAGGYTPYILEKHHVHKIDSPSGTAQTIAESVTAEMKTVPQICSVRAGEIVGEHSVAFEGGYDRIVLTHEAMSRKGFAYGAIHAARLSEKLSGVYEFKDCLS